MSEIIDMLKNPNCKPEVFAEVLRSGKDTWIARTVARDSRCPPEILAEVLRSGKDDLVSYNAVQNPNCPIEILVEILKKMEDNPISWHASQNPNCPPEVLIERLKKNDNVSKYASRNPSYLKYLEKCKEENRIMEKKIKDIKENVSIYYGVEVNE